MLKPSGGCRQAPGGVGPPPSMFYDKQGNKKKESIIMELIISLQVNRNTNRMFHICCRLLHISMTMLLRSAPAGTATSTAGRISAPDVPACSPNNAGRCPAFNTSQPPPRPQMTPSIPSQGSCKSQEQTQEPDLSFQTVWRCEKRNLNTFNSLSMCLARMYLQFSQKEMEKKTLPDVYWCN